MERSLIDIFMPEDMCARCAEKEPHDRIFLDVFDSADDDYSRARLFFCCQGCKRAFVQGIEALKKAVDEL